MTHCESSELKHKPQSRKTSLVTLVGCGDIGRRLANRLDQDSFNFIGLRRSAHSSKNIRYRQVDCTDAAALKTALPQDSDFIVITMTPSQRSDKGYQQAYVQVVDNVLASLTKPPQRIIFASSTSVYPQSKGQWIDEHSAAEPRSYSGKRLLEAEQRLQQSGYPHTIVRFSGIYGPDRNRLIEQVQRGEASCHQPPLYSNRIHIDDCAGVLAHIIEHPEPRQLYLASDCSPTPLQEVKQWIADQLGLPDNHWLDEDDSPLRASKRIDNRALLDSGYEFLYPTFRQGYTPVIERYKKRRPTREQ